MYKEGFADTALYGGSIVTVYSSWTINDWGVVFGIASSVFGVIISIWHKRAMQKIEREKLKKMK